MQAAVSVARRMALANRQRETLSNQRLWTQTALEFQIPIRSQQTCLLRLLSSKYAWIPWVLRVLVPWTLVQGLSLILVAQMQWMCMTKAVADAASVQFAWSYPECFRHHLVSPVCILAMTRPRLAQNPKHSVLRLQLIFMMPFVSVKSSSKSKKTNSQSAMHVCLRWWGPRDVVSVSVAVAVN